MCTMLNVHNPSKLIKNFSEMFQRYTFWCMFVIVMKKFLRLYCRRNFAPQFCHVQCFFSMRKSGMGIFVSFFEVRECPRTYPRTCNCELDSPTCDSQSLSLGPTLCLVLKSCAIAGRKLAYSPKSDCAQLVWKCVCLQVRTLLNGKYDLLPHTLCHVYSHWE